MSTPTASAAALSLQEVFEAAAAPPAFASPRGSRQARQAHMAYAEERREAARQDGGGPLPGRPLESARYVPGQAIAKTRYTHDAVIDLILERPWISQGEIAAIFGYTPAWISQVMSSDAFRAKMEQRREELIDPAIRLSLREKFDALVNKSLDVLQEKLSQPVSQIDPAVALKAAELGAKSLGLGGHAAVPHQMPSNDRLEQLGERLTGLLAVKRERITYEVETQVSSR